MKYFHYTVTVNEGGFLRNIVVKLPTDFKVRKTIKNETNKRPK